MPIFSSIGYILMELFRKTDNQREIYKQMSSTFYTSKDLSPKCRVKKKKLHAFFYKQRFSTQPQCCLTFS